MNRFVGASCRYPTRLSGRHRGVAHLQCTLVKGDGLTFGCRGSGAGHGFGRTKVLRADPAPPTVYVRMPSNPRQSATMQAVASPWSSLEIAKLLVSALTPVAVLLFGLWVNRLLKRFEHVQWANQKVIEKRLSVFDDLAPLCNDVLCYFTYVGCWKEISPPQAVKLKRQLDRIVHINAPLFSPSFVTTYNGFIDACYATYSGWGQDAKLRAKYERRRDAAGQEWNPAWERCFTAPDDVSEPAAVSNAYLKLMVCLSREIGIGLESPHVPAGRAPANIR